MRNSDQADDDGVQLCPKSTVRVANDLGVPYFDLNLQLGKVGIDWTVDTADQGDHLNWQGAEKLSRFLARYLTGFDCLTDRRAEPEYQSWNENYRAYLKKIDSIKTEIFPPKES